jgi:transcriptional/translational regulatory protein YebC/TACO1
VEFKRPNDFNSEEFELEFIDYGLEELQIDDETIYAYADYSDFGTMVKAFEDKKIEIEKAQLERIPNSPVDFSDEQMVDIQKMLDKFEDDEDVQNFYTNMA